MAGAADDADVDDGTIMFWFIVWRRHGKLRVDFSTKGRFT
jgi:hypothetical protein